VVQIPLLAVKVTGRILQKDTLVAVVEVLLVLVVVVLVLKQVMVEQVTH